MVVAMQPPLFPVPLIQNSFGGNVPSGRCSQRVRKFRRVVSDINASIGSLNELYGLDAESSTIGAPSAARRSVHENLLSMHIQSPPPQDVPTPREAFLMLRGSRDSYELPTNLASYAVGRVSLPKVAAALTFSSCLADEVRESVTNFEREVLLPDHAIPVSDHNNIEPYFDPVLRQELKKYAVFLRNLHRKGMLRWSLSFEEQAAFFFREEEIFAM